MKFSVVSLIAVGSLIANVVMWQSSDSGNRESAGVGVTARNSATEITDPPPQLPNSHSVVNHSDTTVQVDRNSTVDIQQGKLLQHADNKDYRALSAELAELGLPDSMVKMLVFAYLNTQESAVRLETNDSYWQQANIKPADSAANMLQSNAARRAQLLQIFGDEITNDPVFYTLFRPYQQSLDFLSSDKQIKLQELHLAAITSAKPKSPTELERDIAVLLGAEDYYEYQLRESPMAKQLQQELAAFAYSEQDYREIFRIKRDSGNQLYDGGDLQFQSAAMSGADFGLNGMNQSKNSAEEEAIRAYLGEERYREYNLSKRPDFRRLMSVADANSLDRNAAVAAYEVLERARTQLTDLHQDTNLNSEEKTFRLDAVLSDTNVQLSTLVGESIAQQFVSEVLEGPRLYRY